MKTDSPISTHAHPWMSPNADNKKREILQQEWGTVMSETYLWYELGDIKHLTQKEIDLIKTGSFVNQQTNFGDMELHVSQIIPDNPPILRLRGKLKLLPSIEIRGRTCSLYAVGHCSDKDYKNFHLLITSL